MTVGQLDSSDESKRRTERALATFLSQRVQNDTDIVNGLILSLCSDIRSRLLSKRSLEVEHPTFGYSVHVGV